MILPLHLPGISSGVALFCVTVESSFSFASSCFVLFPTADLCNYQASTKSSKGHARLWRCTAAAIRTGSKNAPRQSSAPASRARWLGRRGLSPRAWKVSLLLLAPGSLRSFEKFSLLDCLTSHCLKSVILPFVNFGNISVH